VRVFIGNIHCNTNIAELRFILYKCLSRSLWRQLKLAMFYRFDVRRDVALRIVQKKRPDEIVCYGIAEFAQPEVGRLSIGPIGKYVLRGKKLIAHEFVHRAYANERRAVGSGDKTHRNGERRRNERRGARQRMRLPGVVTARQAKYLAG
jgi:hypothetical protein